MAWVSSNSSCSWSQLGTRCWIESQRQIGGLWALSEPRLSSPDKMRKKCCYGQQNLGSICSSLSPSPTHLSHITNINTFQNKVWEVYFYKEVCSFVHWNSSLLLTMFPHIFMYMYCVVVCGYTTERYFFFPSFFKKWYWTIIYSFEGAINKSIISWIFISNAHCLVIFCSLIRSIACQSLLCYFMPISAKRLRSPIIYLPRRLGQWNTSTASLERVKTTTTNECPGFEIKQSYDEAPEMLDIWRIQSTPSLPSLPGPLLFGMRATEKILGVK